MQGAGFDVVTMDTATDRMATRSALATAARESGASAVAVQGNFDPRLLTDGCDVGTVSARAKGRARQESLLGFRIVGGFLSWLDFACGGAT